MIRPYELFIGLRYTRAKRRGFLVSFIALISISGIALGIAALIIVMSVMNGFGKEWRSRILGSISHITISGQARYNRRLPIADWQSVYKTAKKEEQVIGGAPYVEGIALLTRGNASSGLKVQGILPRQEKSVTQYHKKIVSGSYDDLKPGEFGIILGRWWRDHYGIDVGQKVLIVIPRGTVTVAGFLPRIKRFKVVGIFNFDMHQIDSGIALIHIDDAAKLYEIRNGVSGLRLRLEDLDQAPLVAQRLQDKMPKLEVLPWTRQYGGLFQALQTEKVAMFVILLLIVTVAMFNVISTLVVIVKEKESDIAILRTLGASPANIMKIFMVQGTIIGFLGTFIGCTSGVIIALYVPEIVGFLERLFNTHFIASGVYGLSSLPSLLQWTDVAVIAFVSLLLGLLSTIYPAWRAAKVRPAEALRQE
ncbi:MAG TPA: lipoprotein-releasing ABC transporter permease subunit [Acidiferrobacteraceae bacterium]|nr:lipoprotein-releasing ABC transporter permease subunit [Acidiferrobacteraceae bacterium]HEX20046.1 lipoprotein-releasing ABC transporter permease subunit [Acidiferrobacteraceae bacterium]